MKGSSKLSGTWRKREGVEQSAGWYCLEQKGRGVEVELSGNGRAENVGERSSGQVEVGRCGQRCRGDIVRSEEVADSRGCIGKRLKRLVLSLRICPSA